MLLIDGSDFSGAHESLLRRIYMKYYIKQKVFSFRDKFTIKNEQGLDCYFVQGELFSWGKKLHMYDVAGVERAYIKQRIMTFMPKYEVYLNGALAMEVVKKFTFFSQKYEILGAGWFVEGDFWAHEYQVSDGQFVLATISKKWVSWGDSYQIDVAPNVRPEAVLSIVLAIDAAMEEKSYSD